jgi:hypothetical protein
MLTQIKELRTKVKALGQDLINGRLKSKVKYNKLRDQLIDLERKYEMEVLQPEADKLEGQWVDATIRTINFNGELWITTEYGTIWGSIQNDIKSKSWYAETCCIEYVKGQSIKVQLKAKVNDCSIYIEAGKIEGGQVDEIKYAELCKRDDLAFFKRPDNTMTGLC